MTQREMTAWARLDQGEAASVEADRTLCGGSAAGLGRAARRKGERPRLCWPKEREEMMKKRRVDEGK